MGRPPRRRGGPGPAGRRRGLPAPGGLFLQFLAAVALATPTTLEGQDAEPPLRSFVLLDPSLSPLSGTTALQTAVRGVHALEDGVLPVRFGPEDGPGGKILGVGYRLVRLALVDSPVAGLHAIVRHEIAGHGGWIRQLGGDVLEYEIELPPPYGGGGGATVFEFSEAGPLPLAASVAGGLESAHLDARELEERWVARGRMDVREGLQYAYDLLEIVAYIGDARPGGMEAGHDVENYIGIVNGAAPGAASGPRVTTTSLDEAAVAEILNPTLYYSLYAVLWRFLAEGETDAPVPALGVGPLRVMPSVHLRLTPFGREHVLGGTASWAGRVLRAGVRWGNGPWGSFGGLEVEGRRVWTGRRLELGGRLGVWRQYDLAGRSTEGQLGGMAVARGTVSFSGLPVSAAVELGAKSDGYVPGEGLEAGGIARLGFSAVF